MLVLIRNHGCDDVTTGLVEFKTKEELYRFIKIIFDLNGNSTYGCMPTINLYEIDKSRIKLYSNDMEVEDVRDVFSLNGEKYILNLKEYESIYDLEKTENDLILKFIKEECF